jgi:arsenite methyltransferase
MSEGNSAERIKNAVRDAYGSIARAFAEEPQGPAQACCCGPSSGAERAGTRAPRTNCCGPSEASAAQTAANRFYAAEELAELPESVTGASLGCGNPLAIAGLEPGEVVLDLGSGGGIDCFLAARKVGPEGRVIGLDMTPDMIKLARRNARKLGVTNVNFRFGEMEDMPLAGESVDVIISNCVVNLSPDKDAVFGEAYRVLRPGGRLSISDIVVGGELPQFIRSRLDAWAGCIAGALDESVYLAKIRAAGFERVEVLSRERSAVDEATEWDEVQAIVAGDDDQDAKNLLAQSGLSPSDLASKVASIKVIAYKPA